MDQISYEDIIFAYFIYQNWENYMEIFLGTFWGVKILGDLNISCFQQIFEKKEKNRTSEVWVFSLFCES